MPGEGLVILRGKGTEKKDLFMPRNGLKKKRQTKKYGAKKKYKILRLQSRKTDFHCHCVTGGGWPRGHGSEGTSGDSEEGQC